MARFANVQKTDAGSVLESDVPLYHQIYLHMKASIQDGRWIGREDFPGEIDLAKEFGVSVITSRKALDRLDKRGSTTQWVRIWVRHDEPSPEEVFDYETGLWSRSTTM